MNLSSFPFKHYKNMNTYEIQIHENILNPNEINETLENFGGLSYIKEDIKTSILLPLKYPHIFFSDTYFMPSRGVLLHGPPGTGKTLLARAVAKDAHVPFISLSLASLENKYFGESSKLIRGAFSLARKIQPCIVFFDEIDGLLRKRSEMDQSATYGMKTELLQQIDGISSKQTDSVFVIGTTNNLSSLDAAIKRRLPKKIEIALPTLDDRLDILKLKLVEEKHLEESTLKWLAKITHGFSGSDINDLVRQSCSIRLKEYCKDDKFLLELKKAKHVTDLPPLSTLTKAHIMEALSHNMKFKELINYFISQNDTHEDHDEEEEEAPDEL